MAYQKPEVARLGTINAMVLGEDVTQPFDPLLPPPDRDQSKPIEGLALGLDE